MGKISSASLFATFAAAAAEEEEDAGITYKEHFVLLDDKMCVGKQIPAPLLPPRSPAPQEVQAAVLIQAPPIRKEKLFLAYLVCLYGGIFFPSHFRFEAPAWLLASDKLPRITILYCDKINVW